MVRKRDSDGREGVHDADNSKKKQKMDPCTISTYLPQQSIQISVADIEVLQSGVRGVEKPTSHDLTCSLSKVEPLVTCQFMCNSIKKKLDGIWSRLTNKNVSRVGIYGMGGVGKTEIAKCIHNKFLEDPNFSNVCWATVSPNFSIEKLQHAIAKAVNLDLSDEDDVDIRAARLSRSLTKRKNFAIILDDVWNYIPLHTLGIPDSLDGCKLVLTTRSYDVCKIMKSQECFEVCCLSAGEAWELFINERGMGWCFHGEVERVAKSIVERCGGLPLMITVMARRMRAPYSIPEWRNALEEMKESKFIGAYTEVFHKLKLSYDHLEDQSLQQCFLYCALFDEISLLYTRSSREILIQLMIVEKVINVMSNRQAKVDRGDVLLYKLHHACLLEIVRCVNLHMHELIRKMAFQIMSEDHPSIIKIGKLIKYAPDSQLENVVRISFTKCDYISIHSGYFSRCSNVSILLLHDNKKLESLEDALFYRFQRLKVLNLSGSGIVTLPSSISSLEGLRALFLGHCHKLTDIPSLAKLKSLELLDLNDCSEVREVPKGVELLSNLKYLNLLDCGIYELPAGMLTRLLHLEFLAFYQSSTNISGKELADLPKMESLVWCFDDVRELYTYLRNFCRHSHIKYSIFVGQDDNFLFEVQEGEPTGREVLLCNYTIRRPLLIQKGIQKLTIMQVSIDGASGLYFINEVGVNSSDIDLKTLYIRYDADMEYLFNVYSSPSILGSIETIELGYMDVLQDIFGWETENRVPPPTRIPHTGTFSSLKDFTIEYCGKMKKLFPLSLLASLQNLESITVDDCSEMEEIIAASKEESSNSLSHSNFDRNLQPSLPKLRSLKLYDLPELKRICSVQLTCDSLSHIHISECKKLEHVPTHLFPYPFRKISVS